MIYIYIIPFILALVLSLVLTPVVKKLALRYKILDEPNRPRKIQAQPVPLLGGVAIFMAFGLVLILAWVLGWLDDGIIKNAQIWGILIGGLIIVVVGVLDDKFNIRTKSFIGPFLAAVIVVILGVTVRYVTNPFIMGTGPYGRALLYFSGMVGSIFSFVWILGMMYTTKFLDGLDGLASGIGAIGAIILFVVSLFWDVAQSGTSILALALAGSLLGFLVYNWHPAKIFLGESGSVLIGFMLGVLSIISGAKIATALLIMGIPILDVAWVIGRRVFKEKKSPFLGDSKHLHFRLLEVGFSHRQTVLFLYFLTLIFGTSSLFLQSQSKVVAIGIMFVVMVILASILILVYKRKNVN